MRAEAKHVKGRCESRDVRERGRVMPTGAKGIKDAPSTTDLSVA